MPKIDVLNMAGEKVSELELSEAIFAVEPNTSAMHIAVVNYLANQRQGTQSTLTRSEVSGGGKKPWRQKGTGRARQGSTRAPQWFHGGIAHGPKPRSYRTDLNKKMKRVALFSALSDKVAEGSLIVLDECKLEGYKTATMVRMFSDLGLKKENGRENKVLLVLPESDKFVVGSVRNIPTAATTLYSTINVYEIVNAEKLVITREAVEKLTQVYDKEVQD